MGVVLAERAFEVEVPCQAVASVLVCRGSL